MMCTSVGKFNVHVKVPIHPSMRCAMQEMLSVPLTVPSQVIFPIRPTAGGCGVGVVNRTDDDLTSPGGYDRCQWSIVSIVIAFFPLSQLDLLVLRLVACLGMSMRKLGCRDCGRLRGKGTARDG